MRVVSVMAFVLLAACGGGDGGGATGGAAMPLTYDCSVFPRQDTSEYVLPYDVGSTYSANPHAGRTSVSAGGAAGAQYYAIDIVMPIGTSIVATRSGTVVRVEESFVDGDNAAGHENFVIVDHGDGTFARYFHLTNQGALIAVGGRISRSSPLAVSGNTGNSSAPHLHIDIVDARCDVVNASINDALRLCPTLPMSFRNTQTTNCGLLSGVSYTALPFL